MINNKFTDRLILIAMIAFLFILHPQRAIADPVNNLTEQESFFQESYLMLSTKEYKALDQRFKKYLDLYAGNKITAEEFAQKLEIFTRMPGLEPRFDEWINAFPESYTARVARGIYRISDAWEKRGNKFAHSTTDEQFRGFGESLKKAQSDLMLSIQLYSRPVDSYRYLIRISKGLSLGIERNLLDAALKLDPKAFEPRSEYIDAITPKWGGDEGLMTRFLDESNKSPMSDKNKKGIEGKYYNSLAQQAKSDKNYKTASDYYYKYYLTNKEPGALQSSGQAALDGDFKDLAFERFDQLAKEHPKYPYGFELRGYIYEIHFKDNVKAVSDYLAASALGANWSQNRMGWYYMMGINVPVDYIKATYYLDLAAKQGNKTAIENLAILKKQQNGSSNSSATQEKLPSKSL